MPAELTLFGERTVETAAPSSPPAAEIPKSHPAYGRQPVKFACGCGSRSVEIVAHYDIVRCECGKFWWTLQPRRNGPLRFFPWPGPNLTAAELAEKEMAA